MYKQEGYNLVGAAIEVYNTLGHGFLEEVYQECIRMEFTLQKIPFQNHPKLNLFYKGTVLEKYYVPDFYVCDGIVVELKAVKQLSEEHFAQIMNYLRATEKCIGYLLNFGNAKELEWKRIIITR